MRKNVGECLTYEGGPDTNKSAQELTREGQKKNVYDPAPLEDRTQGLLDLNSGTLTIHLRVYRVPR